MASVVFPVGSRLLGEDGQPVDAISIKKQPNWEVAYEIGPTGTSISPPVQLQICFDPEQLPAFERNNAPELGFFQKTQESWSWLELMISEETHCISSTIERLGTYVLIFDIPKGIPQS